MLKKQLSGNSNPYGPIVLHYFDGQGFLQAFGHVALEVGNLYLSFAPSKKGTQETQCYSTQDVQGGLARDIAIYGKPSKFVLPAELYLPQKLVHIQPFLTEWTPKKYDKFTKNCAHCGVAGLLAFLHLDDIDPVLLKNLRGLAKKKYLTPSTVNKLVGRICSSLDKTAVADVKKRASIKENKAPDAAELKITPKPAKCSIEEVLDKTITLLNNQVAALASESSKKKQRKKIQMAILILIGLQEQIPRMRVDELRLVLAHTADGIEAFNDDAAGNLSYCLSLLEDVDEAKENKAYLAEHQVRLNHNDKLMTCYIRYREMLNFLEEKAKSAKMFLLSPFASIFRHKIDEIHLYLLDQFKLGHDPSFEKFDALKKLMDVCFNETVLINFDRAMRGDKENHALQAQTEKCRKLIDDFHVVKAAELTPDKINDFGTQIKEISAVVQTIPLDPQKFAKNTMKEMKGLLGEAKAPPRVIITPQHIDWLYLQIRELSFWYMMIPKTKNEHLERAQAIFIKAYLYRRDHGDKSPEQQFTDLFNLVKLEWIESARQLKKLKSDADATIQAVAAELKSGSKDSFARELGFLMARVKSAILHEPPGKLVDIKLAYQVNFAVLDAKLARADIAIRMFAELKTKLCVLDSAFSATEHLILVTTQLQKFLRDGILNYLDAIKELFIELDRAILLAAKRKPDHKFLHALQDLKKQMLALPDQLQATMPKALLVVENKDAGVADKCAILQKIKLAVEKIIQESKESATPIPEQIQKIAVELGEVADAKYATEQLNRIVAIANGAFANSNFLANLQEQLTKPPLERKGSKLFFLAGIVALQNNDAVSLTGDPYEGLKNLGQQFVKHASQQPANVADALNVKLAGK